MQNYKNLKKIGKKTKERQDPPPRSLELQIKKYRNTTLIPRVCKCISGKACGARMTTTPMSCVTPRFKTQIVHIFKGHQFHPTTNSVF